MNTKRSFSILFVAVLLTSLACSFGAPSISQLETGPVETLTLNEPRPGAGILDVNFDMALGELNLSNGADELLEGEIRHNVADWEPTVVRSNDSLTISQDDGDYTRQGFPGDDIVNVWDVRLGNVPMNLVVSAGA